MKPFLASVAGFILTLAVFGGGTAFGTFFLAGKSIEDIGPGIDTAEVWTDEPRAVDKAAQDLERLPARPARPDPQVGGETGRASAASKAEAAAHEGGAAMIDATATSASTRPDAEARDPFATDGRDPALLAELEDAHVDWCASRYRSYRPRDDSYTPYSGGRRPCISPWSDALDGVGEPASVEADDFAGDGGSQPLVGYVSYEAEEETNPGREHVEDCLRRYRSYRPEDNSYQPYGGGARRQCR